MKIDPQLQERIERVWRLAAGAACGAQRLLLYDASDAMDDGRWEDLLEILDQARKGRVCDEWQRRLDALYFRLQDELRYETRRRAG